MGTLYNNIIALCESRGIKGGKMCTDVGISKGILTDLKSGRKKGVNAVTAQKIASYFNVSVGYLLGEEDQKGKPIETDGLSKKKREFMNYLENLTEEQVDLAFRVLRSIVED